MKVARVPQVPQVSRAFILLLPVVLVIHVLLVVLFVPPAFADTQKNMSVTAFVGPEPIDYQFSLSQQDNTNTVSNGNFYAYTITYGAKQITHIDSPNTVITFNYSQALAPNGQIMFDYVYGSASDGYGGAKPIVDTENKTITWIIPHLPPGATDQTLVFQLFADSYDKATNFPLPLTATMTNDYVTMPEQTFTDYYHFLIGPPGPTATPGPQPTASVTPTPPPQQPFYTVAIKDITDTKADIQVTTSKPSAMVLSYGTSPGSLTKKVIASDYHDNTTLALSNLNPETTYYFTLLITDDTGETVNSDIFTFKTANESAITSLGDTIVVLSSNGTVLFSETQKQIDASMPSVILTPNSNYDISYTFGQPFPLKSIAATVVNQTGTAGAVTVPMEPKAFSAYAASLQAASAGSYDVYVRIADTNGNIIQKQIAVLKVIPRMTIYAQNTNEPLSDARVYLYYYDDQTNQYLPLSERFGIPNPSYTDANGELPFTLPPGRYRADASALFYDQSTVDFTIGSGSGEDFPTFYLKKDMTNLTALFTGIKDYVTDSWNKAVVALTNLASSIRLFHVFTVVVVSSFSWLTFLLFLLRSHIRWDHLPVFVLFGFDMLRNRHRNKYMYGTVTDEDGKPLSQVLVEIEDAKTGNIIAELYTNKLGKFYYKIPQTTLDSRLPRSLSVARNDNKIKKVTLMVTKPGFTPLSESFDTATQISDNGLHLILLKGERHHISFFTFLWKGLEESMGLLFEASLVLSIVLEVLFCLAFGLAKTIPFLILSLLNIILWVFYAHQSSKIKETLR